MRNLLKASVVVCVMLVGSASASAASVTPEELQKQNDFKKAYSSPDKEDHLKAVAFLDGGTHETTRQFLVTVVQVDTYKEVQIEAYKLLSQFPARDPGLSQQLLSLFLNLKLNDIDTRIAFAAAMKNSEFKLPLIEALVEFGSKLRYPDLVTNYGNGNQPKAGTGGMYGGDPNVGIKKSRAEFEKFVAAFNAVTKAGMKAADKDSPMEFKKWLNSVRNKLMTDDREVFDKYRKEEADRLNKNNPLIAGKKDSAEEKKDDEKKDKKDDEKKDDKKDEKKDDKKAMKKKEKDE